jgi:hypothetical protein
VSPVARCPQRELHQVGTDFVDHGRASSFAVTRACLGCRAGGCSQARERVRVSMLLLYRITPNAQAAAASSSTPRWRAASAPGWRGRNGAKVRPYSCAALGRMQICSNDPVCADHVTAPTIVPCMAPPTMAACSSQRRAARCARVPRPGPHRRDDGQRARKLVLSLHTLPTRATRQVADRPRCGQNSRHPLLEPSGHASLLPFLLRKGSPPASCGTDDGAEPQWALMVDKMVLKNRVQE